MRLLTLLFLLFSFKSFAGKNDTSFYDKDWKPVDRSAATYFRLPLEKENGLYKVSDFYINGNKQMEGHFASKKGEFKVGHFAYYNEHGNKTDEGNYKNGKPDSVWTFYDSITSKVLYTETYIGGQRFGEVVSYYPSGKVKTRENWEWEKVTGKRYDEQGNEVPFKPFYVRPKFSTNTFEFLGKNIVYPEICARNYIEGTSIVGFTIKEDGTLTDLHIQKTSGDADLDKEALRVVALMKQWQPGSFDDKVVEMKMTQAVSFRISGG